MKKMIQMLSLTLALLMSASAAMGARAEGTAEPLNWWGTATEESFSALIPVDDHGYFAEFVYPVNDDYKVYVTDTEDSPIYLVQTAHNQARILWADGVSEEKAQEIALTAVESAVGVERTKDINGVYRVDHFDVFSYTENGTVCTWITLTGIPWQDVCTAELADAICAELNASGLCSAFYDWENVLSYQTVVGDTHQFLYDAQSAVDAQRVQAFLDENYADYALHFGKAADADVWTLTSDQDTASSTDLAVCLALNEQFGLESRFVCLEGNDGVLVGENMLPENGLVGDVTLDGVIDICDTVILNRHVAGMVQLTDAQKRNADLTNDQQVDQKDCMMLMQLLVGKIKAIDR